MHKIYNHQTSSLSDLDLKMVTSVPTGGNWKDIPINIPSKRLDRIREEGGRTTYYGRLSWDKPSYTISTYFNRPGNGCNMHPNDKNSKLPQHRLLSFREAARIQSFRDDFIFYGSKSSIYKQIGNAVPPLMAYGIGKTLRLKNVVDLFCGCGGLSKGLELSGYEIIAGCDNDKSALETWTKNHNKEGFFGDLTKKEDKTLLIKNISKSLGRKNLDLLAGGPPCQGFSTAGWREDADPRNNLWSNYLDLVDELNPKFILIENVQGIMSMKNKKGGLIIDDIFKTFMKKGYFLSAKILNSANFGVPQLRKRAFIIGRRNDQEKAFFPNKYLDKHLTVFDAISDLPKLGTNDGKFETVLRKNNNPKSNYQKWARGIITTEIFLDSIEELENPQSELNI
jgi:DNA (cytosine-5)-methyltransferase 1